MKIGRFACAEIKWVIHAFIHSFIQIINFIRASVCWWKSHSDIRVHRIASKSNAEWCVGKCESSANKNQSHNAMQTEGDMKKNKKWGTNADVHFLILFFGCFFPCIFFGFFFYNDMHANPFRKWRNFQRWFFWSKSICILHSTFDTCSIHWVAKRHLNGIRDIHERHIWFHVNYHCGKMHLCNYINSQHFACVMMRMWMVMIFLNICLACKFTNGFDSMRLINMTNCCCLAENYIATRKKLFDAWFIDTWNI